jgi:hypothetical protein
MNAREPGQPGSPNELQQKRLGLIVARVPDRNAIGVRRHRCAMEEVVAQSTRRVFNRQSLRRGIAGNVYRFDLDRKVSRIGKRATERLIAVGCRSKPMIQMREADDVESTVLRHLAEDQRERNRIRTAGHTNQHAASGRTQAMALNGTADLLMKSRARHLNPADS